jgi:hypothetical protein
VNTRAASSQGKRSWESDTPAGLLFRRRSLCPMLEGTFSQTMAAASAIPIIGVKTRSRTTDLSSPDGARGRPANAVRGRRWRV